jgi:hypothetical protein
LVFDESHKAKNKTKTCEAVNKLQELCPKARVVYVSATGASEPPHMRYMTRLGIWGSGHFESHNHFVQTMKKVAAVITTTVQAITTVYVSPS